MIALTAEERLKLELMDKLFAAMNMEEVAEMSQREEIVSRLKGINDNPYRLRQIVDEFVTAQGELVLLRSEINMLKNDIASMIRVVKSFYENMPSYNGDLQLLKSKYNIY